MHYVFELIKSCVVICNFEIYQFLAKSKGKLKANNIIFRKSLIIITIEPHRQKSRFGVKENPV